MKPIVLSLELFDELRGEFPGHTTQDEVRGQTANEVLGTCNGHLAGTWSRFVGAGLIDAAELGLLVAQQRSDDLSENVTTAAIHLRARLAAYERKTPSDLTNDLLKDTICTLEQIARNGGRGSLIDATNARVAAMRLREHLK